jgi:hypothetical protein
MTPARHRLVQLAGIVLTALYGTGVVWLYATQPRSLADAGTQAQVAAGTYRVDETRFASGLDLFRRDQFSAARAEWSRADPAERDPRVQFYIAYSFYRQGWGRFQSDDTLFRAGLAAVQRATALSSTPLRVSDPNLRMNSAAELQAELEAGLTRSVDDFNPLKLAEDRK